MILRHCSNWNSLSLEFEMRSTIKKQMENEVLTQQDPIFQDLRCTRKLRYSKA